jgi:hypothetical protein
MQNSMLTIVLLGLLLLLLLAPFSALAPLVLIAVVSVIGWMGWTLLRTLITGESSDLAEREPTPDRPHRNS